MTIMQNHLEFYGNTIEMSYASFKSEQKTTGQAGNYGTKDVQVMAPLKS